LEQNIKINTKQSISQSKQHQSLLKGVSILPCEMQHTCMCCDQCRLAMYVSLNVIIIVWNI